MEIKATLNKPYTEEQRMDFIIQQNHNNGYEIRETDKATEAWGYTEEEITEHKKQLEINQIKDELKELDFKRIRAVCENEIKDSSTGERWLEFYNKQISDLRKKLASL